MRVYLERVQSERIAEEPWEEDVEGGGWWSGFGGMKLFWAVRSEARLQSEVASLTP